MFLELVLFSLFPALVGAAAVADALTMKIPNTLSALLLALFPLMALYCGLDLYQILTHFGIAAIVLIVTFAAFSFRLIGGGDAKFATVIALWIGSPLIIEFAVLSAIFGGILTIGIVLLRWLPMPAICYSAQWSSRLLEAKGDIPYGVALAAAALFIYQRSVWYSVLVG